MTGPLISLDFTDENAAPIPLEEDHPSDCYSFLHKDGYFDATDCPACTAPKPKAVELDDDSDSEDSKRVAKIWDDMIGPHFDQKLRTPEVSAEAFETWLRDNLAQGLPSVDILLSGNDTALLRAVALGYEDKVQVLMDLGADPTIGGSKGWAAIHEAIRRFSRPVLDQAVKANPEHNWVETFVYTISSAEDLLAPWNVLSSVKLMSSAEFFLAQQLFEPTALAEGLAEVPLSKAEFTDKENPTLALLELLITHHGVEVDDIARAVFRDTEAISRKAKRTLLTRHGWVGSAGNISYAESKKKKWWKRKKATDQV